MKMIIACLVTVASLNAIYAQIKWDVKRPLTWKDFSGKIDNSSFHYANTKTSTNYQYQVHYHNNIYTLTFAVECVFLQTGSWCKPYKQTNVLLNHEQLHFDIEEIFARKLMAAFKARSYTANYAAEVKLIYDGIAKEAMNLQKKYDLETDYSEMGEAQIKWEKFIHEQLKNK